MADHLTKIERSKNMAAIKSKNTSPEIAIRKILHSEGFRYRLHDKKLPGKPDLVFKKYRTVIFVHGCFWHQHKNCKRANIPKSNVDYWITKISKNVQRDKGHLKELRKKGWRVLTVWECQVKNLVETKKKLIKTLLNNS